MNKKEFIQQEIQKNKERFGRWHSTSKKDSACNYKLMFDPPPSTHEECIAHGNALASAGNYPVGTSDCFNVGISGGCGVDCFVYLEGRCEEPQEMIHSLESGPEFSRHCALYPQDRIEVESAHNKTP